MRLYFQQLFGSKTSPYLSPIHISGKTFLILSCLTFRLYLTLIVIIININPLLQLKPIWSSLIEKVIRFHYIKKRQNSINTSRNNNINTRIEKLRKSLSRLYRYHSCKDSSAAMQQTQKRKYIYYLKFLVTFKMCCKDIKCEHFTEKYVS
jgi:hypothetical protein